MFYKLDVLKNFSKFTKKKTCAGVNFNNVAGLKDLFSWNIFGQLLLNVASSKIHKVDTVTLPLYQATQDQFNKYLT